MGFAGWVVLGVVAGWIACSIPTDCERAQVGRLVVGVLGAVLGGVVASLLGVGSGATVFSLGAWLAAFAGAAALLVMQSIYVERSRPPHLPRSPRRRGREGPGKPRRGAAVRWARECPDNARLTPYARASSSPTMGP